MHDRRARNHPVAAGAVAALALHTTASGHHGFDVVYEETPGGHTWANWRAHLRDFAPLLLR